MNFLGKYEEAVGTAKLAGRQQFSEDLIEGAQSGEPLDATYRKLASNAGLGTIGRRILANRLYEAKHGIFSDRAFGSDEKLYELNGKKFSGLEALNDRQMTAVVQAKVTRDLARDMRETLGVTELLYFTEGKFMSLLFFIIYSLKSFGISSISISVPEIVCLFS